MDPITAAVIGSAVIGAVSGEMQGRKNRQAMKDQMREQAKRDKMNMLAAAYGINAQISPAPYMRPSGAEAMQGALGGAQFAVMNPSLWDSKDNSAYSGLTNKQQLALMQTEAAIPQQTMASQYGGFYPGQYGGFNPYQ